MSRPLRGAALLATAGAALLAAPAGAAVTQTVQPGQTLSGIAAANGLPTEALASWNGLAADAGLLGGQAIEVPTAAEAGVTPPAASGATSSGAGHTVLSGESLSSIAAANGITVSSLAAANGLSETAFVIEGSSLTIPAADASNAASTAPVSGLGAIPSPWGDLYLDPAAAEAWNAMRAESLASYGQDLHPAGPASAYRTFDQQADLHELFVSGQGNPANPPGSSSHEVGLSVDVATAEMRWVVDQIGWQYGWGKLEAPGEWWHVTYGG